MTPLARTPPPRGRVGWTLAALLAFAGFVALGIWQLERRAWKLGLMAQVEARLAAPPEPAPGPPWPSVARTDAYRRLVVAGTFDHAREACTQAVTDYGAGCWVMTPLHTDAGWWVLVNRGFVPADRRLVATRRGGQVAGRVRVVGLERLSEPGGGFLRRNDPASGRWYSRDVAAIAAARGLPAARVAPYFLDADAASTVPGGPIGGLTVVRFRNEHLQYALTWFALAGLSLGAVWMLWRPRAAPGPASVD